MRGITPDRTQVRLHVLHSYTGGISLGEGKLTVPAVRAVYLETQPIRYGMGYACS